MSDKDKIAGLPLQIAALRERAGQACRIAKDVIDGLARHTADAAENIAALTQRAKPVSGG